MDLNYQIFKSAVPPHPRFAKHDEIQSRLKEICVAWGKYLQKYVERTARMFGEPEMPWVNTERAIVSTLSASIIRKYSKSIVLEESRVVKPGRNPVSDAGKRKKWGRCDLWVSIDSDRTGPFNFYLEAKVSPKNWNTDNLEEHLQSWYGLSKMFRDYMKSHPDTLVQRSPYRKQRKHEHYIIGMYLTRLEPKEDIPSVKEILRDVFEKAQSLDLGRNANDADGIKKYRRMVRYPTVALILTDASGRSPGFVASFTVLPKAWKFINFGMNDDISTTAQQAHAFVPRTGTECRDLLPQDQQA